ncbi:MAG: hypothetical protein NUW22_10590 [Acidobacteria bacterium]|nr:hypothetical protein [Acidobacteriota bacterium]
MSFRAIKTSGVFSLKRLATLNLGCCHERKSGEKTPDVFIATTGVAIALATKTALACPVCFRVEESAATDGVVAAVLVLVGVTTVVLGAFARFIVGVARRERGQCRR